jgi:bifunctional non-homologous end joining protein LigD
MERGKRAAAGAGTLPRHVAPMLATAGPMPRDEDRWAFEVKWDGVRALAYLDRGRLELESRNLLDITPRYPELSGLAAAVGPDRRAVLDGEVVAFDETGRPSFEQLQKRMHVEPGRSAAPVAYVLFDVLWLDGAWLLQQPYTSRRAALEKLLAGRTSSTWQLSPSHAGTGTATFEATLAAGLEGVVAKRLDSTYEPGRRSRAWIKVKHLRRQELVIGGWVPGRGGRAGHIGALLLGYHEGGQLRSAGKVGTGFTADELERLAALLGPLTRPGSPFAGPVPDERIARFVEPVLVAEVAFREWTAAGLVRQASYRGLRDDKAATDVVREEM